MDKSTRIQSVVETNAEMPRVAEAATAAAKSQGNNGERSFDDSSNALTGETSSVANSTPTIPSIENKSTARMVAPKSNSVGTTTTTAASASSLNFNNLQTNAQKLQLQSNNNNDTGKDDTSAQQSDTTTAAAALPSASDTNKLDTTTFTTTNNSSLQQDKNHGEDTTNVGTSSGVLVSVAASAGASVSKAALEVIQGRGRPRKNPYPLDDNVATASNAEDDESNVVCEVAANVSEAASAVKQGRGRPRKNSLTLDDAIKPLDGEPEEIGAPLHAHIESEEDATVQLSSTAAVQGDDLQELPADTALSKTDKPSQDDSPGVTDHDDDVDSNVGIAASASVSETAPAVKRGRVRPPKKKRRLAIIKPLEVEFDEFGVPIPKRKRGRPRIYPPADPNAPKKPPGKRGRPRKIVNEEDAFKEPVVKRKVGRPRTRPLLDPNTPPAKRGRPRKTTEEDESDKAVAKHAKRPSHIAKAKKRRQGNKRVDAASRQPSPAKRGRPKKAVSSTPATKPAPLAFSISPLVRSTAQNQRDQQQQALLDDVYSGDVSGLTNDVVFSPQFQQEPHQALPLPKQSGRMVVKPATRGPNRPLGNVFDTSYTAATRNFNGGASESAVTIHCTSAIKRSRLPKTLEEFADAYMSPKRARKTD
jgi:hypothetical protein